MAAAGAAPARKGAARAGEAAPPTQIPPHVKKGALLYDNVVFLNKHRVLVGVIQHRIIDFIELRTTGDYKNGRLEWAALTYKEIQEFGYEVTKQAILDALGELSSGDFPLIEVDEVSHKKRRYRLLRANFEKAPTVGPRKLNLEDDDEDPEEDEDEIDASAVEEDEDEIDGEVIASAQPVVARSVVHLSEKPVLFALKKKYRGILLGGRGTAASLVPCRGGYLKLNADALAGRKADPVENDPTRLGSSLQSLREAIEPVFVRSFKKDLDDVFLSKIAGELGDAPPDALAERIRVRAPKQSGLVLALARDVRNAHAVIERGRKPAAPPPAPVKPFDAEPEGTGSAWDKIRQQMKKKQLAPQEYENWFSRTRFVSLEWNTLKVACVDSVTCDFLDQEYMEQLLQIANYDLELGISKFEWEADYDPPGA